MQCIFAAYAICTHLNNFINFKVIYMLNKITFKPVRIVHFSFFLPVLTGVAQRALANDAVVVSNPYGLDALWMQSDLATKSVLFILAIMSMMSWYVIVTKLIEQSRMKKQAQAAQGDFWDAHNVQTGAQKLPANSPFRFVAESGLHAIVRYQSLSSRMDIADWLELSIHRATERVQRRLTSGMSILATVGSTSPFVGLFGTVWGIYHALTAIGVAGQASIDKVAGPVGEALIMTAIGLAVAVPAVLGYNWLLRRNSGVMDDVRDFSGELHTVLLSSDPAAHMRA